MYCQHCFAENPIRNLRCIECGKPIINSDDASLTAHKADLSVRDSVVGLLAGAIVGWYSGVYLLILLVFTFSILWLGKKLLVPARRTYFLAVAFQAGQVLMLVAFTLFLFYKNLVYVQLSISFILELLIPIFGLIWLILKPGLKPIILLTLFQCFALVINGINLSSMEVGTLNHKALAAHILWRIIALFLMWKTYFIIRRTAVSQLDVNRREG